MAVVVAIVASSKGYSAFLWFLYGFVVWPIALVHILVLPKSTHKLEEEKVREGRIRCPSCSEWIFSTATSCPHCSKKIGAESKAAARGGLPASNIWTSQRNLEDAAYKIYLADTYSIEKHDLFDKYVCKDKMFDQLQEALDYAHELDLAVANNPALLKKETGRTGPQNNFSYSKYGDGSYEITHASGLSLMFESAHEAHLFFKFHLNEENVINEMSCWPQEPERRNSRRVITQLDLSNVEKKEKLKVGALSSYVLYRMRNGDLYLDLRYGHRKVGSLEEAKEHLGIKAT